ncbi:hypothetical protein AGMMS50256_03580 [Betaproteobacteria bacterium]|nr:hypothetical protein AGMMS50256_03580 [Betaproteobacteria bacterium]
MMQSSSRALIELRNLSKFYDGAGPVAAVSDICLEIQKREVFALMGTSGSGKSTLLRHINRLIDPSSGSVIVDGQELQGLSRQQLATLRSHRIGMVFQHFGLLPHRTALENVMLPFELRGDDPQTSREKAAEQLTLVGLGNALHRYPDELSGGMQQRVGLARALASQPDILLMDEPFGALDPTIRRDLQDQVLELIRSRGITAILVTHDPGEALRMADRLALLRAGRIVQVGTAKEILQSPADAEVAAFFRGFTTFARDDAQQAPVPPPVPSEEAPQPSVETETDAPLSLRQRLLSGPVRFFRCDAGLFWAGMFLEAAALAFFAHGFSSGSPFVGVLSLVAFAAIRVLSASLKPVRQSRSPALAFIVSLAIYGFVVWRAATLEPSNPLFASPNYRVIALTASAYLDQAITWAQLTFTSFFAGIVITVRTVIECIEAALKWLPWPVLSLALLLAAWQFAGLGVAALTAVALAYLLLFGFWSQTILTVALVGASVSIAFLFGIPIGILLARSRLARSIVSPLLDVMQTLPSFVYLIPAVAFFSVGKTPAVVATIIFAIPPMIRLTALGIQEVPRSTVEAAYAHGASAWQVLTKVELPLAMPTLMLGVNQTIVLSLSMVVVSALIGAGGLGYDVVTALRNIQGGAGFLAGLAIVFCALVPDRILQRALRKKKFNPKH